MADHAPLTIVPLTIDDREAMLALDQSAFAFDTRGMDPETDTAMVEWDRSFSAERGGERAGIYTVFSFDMAVPGVDGGLLDLPTAGLSWVAVHPDHRRHGVLRAMIAHHLETVHERGTEPVSILYASEPPIYGRYGYGIATSSVQYLLPAHAPLRAPDDPTVRTRFLPYEHELHHDLVVSLGNLSRRRRAGHTVRPVSHWDRTLRDAPDRRPGGAEALRIVVAERDGATTGFALLRRKASWGDRRPEGTINVLTLRADDTGTEAALWRRVLDFDLMAEVVTNPLPADHPLSVWASDVPGAAVRADYALWVRLVDVPAALTARRYRGSLDVVIGLTDSGCPWNAGTWRLEADGDSVSCEASTRQADLELDVRELGSAYLGGVTLASLGDAGLVREHTPGSLASCSAAWRTDLLPASPAMF